MLDYVASDSAEELTLNNDASGDDNMLAAGSFDESNESSSSSSFGDGESETHEYIEG